MNAGHIKTTDFHTRAGVKKKIFLQGKDRDNFLRICTTARGLLRCMFYSTSGIWINGKKGRRERRKERAIERGKDRRG